MPLSPEEERELAELEAWEASQVQQVPQPVSGGLSPTELAELAELEAWEAGQLEAAQEPRTFKERLGGALLKGMQGVTFHLADEIGAAGSAALDYINPFNERDRTYSEWLAAARRGEEEFDERNPYISTLLEIGGGLASPAVGLKAVQGLSKVPLLGKVANTSVGRGALAGATEAAAYGLGSGEGGLDERLSTAVDSAQMGGIFGGALGGVGAGYKALAKGAEKAGEAMQRSAVGIGAADLRKAAKGPGKFLRKMTGENPLKGAFDRLRARGAFKDGIEPDRLINKKAVEVEELSNELTELLTKADDKLPYRVFPSLKNAQKYVDSLYGLEREAAQKVLTKTKDVLTQQLDGSLSSLQKAKKSFNARTYSSSVDAYQKKLDRMITYDLKTNIEDAVDILAKKGNISKKMQGQVKKLNRNIGDWEALDDVLTKAEARESAKDLSKGLISAIKTTGGFGVPILGGSMIAGAPGLLAGAGLAYGAKKAFVDPKGRYATGELLQRLPQAIPGAAKASQKIPAILLNENGGETLSHKTAGPPEGTAPQSPTASARTPSAQLINNVQPIASNIPTANLQKAGFNIDNVSPFLKAIMAVESNFNPKATSKAGGRGLMQIMPFWDKNIGKIAPHLEGFDAYNPEHNILVGTAILEDEMKRFNGNVALALAAYNVGSPAVLKAIKKAGSKSWPKVKRFLPKETREYPGKVIAKLNHFEKLDGSNVG